VEGAGVGRGVIVGQIINPDAIPPRSLKVRKIMVPPNGNSSEEIGGLALVSKVWCNFIEYLEAHANHKFTVEEENAPCSVWWGEYSRGAMGKDEWFDGFSLRHWGWGKTTLGLLGPNIGTIVDTVANTGNLVNSTQTATETGADGVAKIFSRMPLATPTERKKKQLRRQMTRGNVKRQAWQDLKHNLNVGNRFFLAVTKRSGTILNKDKKKRLLVQLDPGQNYRLGDLIAYL
jgi:hypothetical protein